MESKIISAQLIKNSDPYFKYIVTCEILKENENIIKSDKHFTTKKSANDYVKLIKSIMRVQ